MGWAILSQPELTDHALKVLLSMPALDESLQLRLRSSVVPARIVLRSAPQDDIVFICGHDSVEVSRCQPTHAAADVELEPAQRLLVLWCRREPRSPIDIHAEGGRILVRLLLLGDPTNLTLGSSASPCRLPWLALSDKPAASCEPEFRIGRPPMAWTSPRDTVVMSVKAKTRSEERMVAVNCLSEEPMKGNCLREEPGDGGGRDRLHI